jgi:hypothetical protein
MDADSSVGVIDCTEENGEVLESVVEETTVVPTQDAVVLNARNSWPPGARVDVLYDDLWWRCVVLASTMASDDRLWVRFDVDGSTLPIIPEAVPEMVRAPGPDSDVATALPTPPSKKAAKKKNASKATMSNAKFKAPHGNSKEGRQLKAAAKGPTPSGNSKKRPSDKSAAKETAPANSLSAKKQKVELKSKAPHGNSKEGRVLEAAADGQAPTANVSAKAAPATSTTSKKPASASTKARSKPLADNCGATSVATVAAAGIYGHLGQRMSSEFTVAPKRAAGKPTGSRADWVYRQQLAGPLLKVKANASRRLLLGVSQRRQAGVLQFLPTRISRGVLRKRGGPKSSESPQGFGLVALLDLHRGPLCALPCLWHPWRR